MNSLISIIKRWDRLYRFLRYSLYAPARSFNRKKIFTNIYERNLWDGTESISGPGSSLDATMDLRESLPRTLRELDIRSLLDAPCGDLAWIRHVPLGIDRYIGADIVPALIEVNRKAFGSEREFVHLDLIRDPLPAVDAVLCRDFLVHLSLREATTAVKNIVRAGPRFFLATTFPDVATNADTVTPYWRALNLQAAPFNFPPPLRLIRDFSEGHQTDEGKYLGVWLVADLKGR